MDMVQVVAMDLALARQVEATTIHMYQHMPMQMLRVMVVAQEIVKMVGVVVVMVVVLGTVVQSLRFSYMILSWSPNMLFHFSSKIFCTFSFPF